MLAFATDSYVARLYHGGVKPKVSPAQILDDAESLIDHGSRAQAAALISHLCATRSLPREQLARLANLARRCWLPEKSIQLLHRIVRPTDRTRQKQPASELERLEYGAALNAVGASREALKLFDEVDPRRHPAVELYRGYAHLRLWDFDAGIEALERFIAPAAPAGAAASPVQLLRGKLELAGALIDGPGEYARAEKLLAELRRATGSGQFRTIHKETFLILAQSGLHQRDWAKAHAALAELERLNSEDEDGFLILLTRKWKGIVSYAETRSSAALEELRQVREKLRAEWRWEDVRYCHFWEAATKQDTVVLTHLYFGTPYAAFRAKIAEVLGSAPQGEYLWKISSSSAKDPKAAPVFDVLKTFKPGEAMQRLLIALSRDFYRPLTLHELHELVFENEYFNPNSSPDRVHQLLKRTRQWLKKNRIPLEVAESAGFYSLASPSRCLVRIADAAPSRQSDTLEKLRAAFDTKPFTSAQAAEALGISARSALRALTDALARHQLEQTAPRPRPLYRLR